MINIITIKWGTKYSSNYPNRIYNECKKYCTFPFNFYCITDNPEGLNEGIIPLEMPTHSRLNYNDYIQDHLDGKVGLWDRPKLYVFKDFNHKFTGLNIMLDLDCQIWEDLKVLTTFDMSKPWIIDAYWNQSWGEFYDRGMVARVNSSITVWKDTQLECITDYVIKNLDAFEKKYATIDCVINYEFIDYEDYRKTLFNWLPSTIYTNCDPDTIIKGYKIGLHGTTWGRHNFTPAIFNEDRNN